MTDREVLDLVLTKVTGLERDVVAIKEDVAEIKGQIVDLKATDSMILSEVERVHDILDIHKEDKTVHIA